MKPVNMCEGPLAKKLLRFTVPVMLTGLLQLLYSTADVVILGNLGGEASVSAVGATATIINLIVNVFMGLSVGVTVTAAAAIGARDADTVRDTVQTTAVLGVICGAVAGTLGILFSPLLLTAMRTPTETMHPAVLYIRLYFLGAPANLLYNFLAALLRAKGETRLPLFVLIFSGAFKILMTVLFVGGLHMDVAGAATATVLSQYLSAVLMVLYLCHRKDEMHLRLRQKHLRPRRDILWEIIRLGVPSGVQSAVFSLSAMVVQSAVNSFGEAMVTGNTAAGNIDTISYSLHDAFSYTAISFVAQNHGAGKEARVRRSVLLCLGMAALTAIVSGAVIYLFGRPLLNLYIPGREEAISYGMIRLKYICLPYFFLAAMDVMSGVLRGLGSAVAPAVISLAGACGLRILWIYTVFAAYRTPETLFLCFPVTWAATFFALTIDYCILRRWMRKQKNA